MTLTDFLGRWPDDDTPDIFTALGAAETAIDHVIFHWEDDLPEEETEL